MATTATISRRIYFYRVMTANGPGGKPLPFDIKACTTALNKPDRFKDGQRDAYLTIDAEKETVAWALPYKGKPPVIQIATVRRQGLPAVETAGHLNPLQITDKQGLAESSHAVFFPNNIVGWEFNFHGPRIGRLRDYLTAKVPGCMSHNFGLLVHGSVLDQVDDLQDVRMIDLQLSASWVDRIGKANASLGEGFEQLFKAGKAAEVEVVLKAARGGALAGGLKILQRLIRMPGFREEASKAKARGKSQAAGKVELIDLLNDALIVHAEIRRQTDRLRAVESESAVEAIIAAHADKKDELATAVAAIA